MNLVLKGNGKNMKAKEARARANAINNRKLDKNILKKILSDISEKSSYGFYSMQYTGLDNIPFEEPNSFVYVDKLKSLGYECDFFRSNGGVYFYIAW